MTLDTSRTSGHRVAKAVGQHWSRWLLSTLVGFLAMQSAVVEGQPMDPGCPYRNANGECRQSSIFNKRRPKPPPQQILIDSEPRGAVVWIDGKRQEGLTPLTVKKPLRPGEHSLTLELDNHLDYSAIFSVKRYGKQESHHRLVSWPKLKFTLAEALPEDERPAEIYIDGQKAGELPLDEPIFIEPGSRTIWVIRSGYLSFTKVYREHELEPDQITDLTVSLEKNIGTLELEANLEGIDVVRVAADQCRREQGKASDSGTFLGVTPINEKALSPGAYCVEFQIPGVGAHRRTIIVEQGQKSFYSFQFPIPRAEKKDLNRLWGKWREQAVLSRCHATSTFSTVDPEGRLPDRCFRLAVSYHHRQQDEEALPLYRRACRLGSARACEAHASMLYWGRGGERNRAEAREYLEKACSPGLKRACYRVYLRDEDQEEESPRDIYNLVAPAEIEDHDSLVYEAWFSFRTSLRRQVQQNSNFATLASVGIDIPLGVFPFIGSQLGDNHWSPTLGYRLGGLLRIPKNSEHDFEGDFVGVGVAKLKTVWWRGFYMDVEIGTEPSVGGALGFRPRLPWEDFIVIKAGVLYHFGTSVEVFISVGPAMGWVLDR